MIQITIKAGQNIYYNKNIQFHLFEISREIEIVTGVTMTSDLLMKYFMFVFVKCVQLII